MSKPIQKRRCTKCQRMKPDDEFDATESQCKKCRAKAKARK